MKYNRPIWPVAVIALLGCRRASGGGLAHRHYGERECTVEDLAGHRWQFSETLRDVSPE
jgi:hypothetical protein